MEALFFWIFAIGLVGGGITVILTRNPVSSALALAATFVFLAALFVTLEAFFLAMVQIIVYAGAVMVLFLFIIMLLDIKEEAQLPIPYFRIAMVGVLSIVFFLVFDQVLTGLTAGDSPLTSGDAKDSSAGEVGKLLFSKYLVPFEVTAVLLLVATMGVVFLSKKESKDSKEEDKK